ncbi:MAG: hypothetical protein PHI85_05920 [Victivallaceae bacterium]|nr:hypothetical protein [Victivallaceae bacterium]
MKKLLTIFIILCAVITGPAAETPAPEALLRTGDAARQSGLNFRIVRKSSELGTFVFYRRSNGDSHSEIGAIHRIKNRNGEFQYAAGGEVAIKRLPRGETASADDALPERFELGDTTFNGRPAYAATAFYPDSDEREYRVWYIFKEPVFTIGATMKMRDGTIYEVIPQQIEFFDELPDKLFEIPAGMRIYQPPD